MLLYHGRRAILARVSPTYSPYSVGIQLILLDPPDVWGEGTGWAVPRGCGNLSVLSAYSPYSADILPCCSPTVRYPNNVQANHTIQTDNTIKYISVQQRAANSFSPRDVFSTLTQFQRIQFHGFFLKCFFQPNSLMP